MRLLWFAHGPADDIAVRAGLPPSGTGSWTYALAEQLCQLTDCDLVVACHAPVSHRLDEWHRGVHHVLLPDNRSVRALPDSALVDDCGRLIAEFDPDVVHVHGVEKSYALALAELGRSPVATIHGLIHLMRPKWWGGLSPREIVRIHLMRDLGRGRQPMNSYMSLDRRGALEREVIRAADTIIGVTDWDEAHVRDVQPGARYTRIAPVIRNAFFERQWEPRLDGSARTIVTPSAMYPAKGLHVLLRAIEALRPAVGDVRLAVAGHQPSRSDGYHRFLLDQIARNGLNRAVRFVGFQDGPGLTDLYAESAAVAIPSWVENYSVSLLEAMVVGAPSVVAYTGGLGSMARDHSSVLFVPPGDHQLMAHHLATVLTDSKRAAAIGQQARREALARHDPTTIVAATMSVYDDVAGRSTNTSGNG